MAYLPPSLSRQRLAYESGATPTESPSTLGGSGVSSDPQTGGTPGPAPANTLGGGRFQALRAFFDANRPAAESAAASAAAPVEARAQEAVSLAGESEKLPENKGGAEKAASASAARDDALSRIGAAAQGTFGDGAAPADYNQGSQAADSYLYSRSNAVQGLQRWTPVLNSLDPKYGAPYYDPVAPASSGSDGYHPTVLQRNGDTLGRDVLGIQSGAKHKELRAAAGILLPGVGTVGNLLTSGKTGRYLDPTSSGGLYDDAGALAKKGLNKIKGLF